MPGFYHTAIFWIYWLIVAVMGLMLVAVLIKEHDKSKQIVAAMLLVPVILRLLLIK